LFSKFVIELNDNVILSVNENLFLKSTDMKHFISLIVTILILTAYPRSALSQCQPDTVNCKDVLLPGEICPLIVPDGTVNVPYEQVFTVIPPNQADIQTGTVNIIKIVIDTVGNLPPGLSYQTNSDTFYVDTAYCILLSGTPTIAGVYDLHIRVIPYIYSWIFNMVIEGPAIDDDTSLTIIIREPSGIDEFRGKTFAALEAIPNPFETTTRIGFYTRTQGQFELSIYNLLGQLTYSENITGVPGRNYFNFNGIEMKPGTYLYNITGNGNSITKKLIRLR
jgi:hypothetical protein